MNLSNRNGVFIILAASRCVFGVFGFTGLGVESCGRCGVCSVEIQLMRVDKNGTGHPWVINGIYEEKTRTAGHGGGGGGGVSIYYIENIDLSMVPM